MLVRTALLVLLLLAANGRAAAVEWQPVVSPYDQLFPSLLIATAGLKAQDPDAHVLGDTNGVVGASVRATHDQQRALLRIRMPGYAHDSVLEVKLPHAGERYALYPVMRWDFQRLLRLRQAAPDSIEFTLELDGEPAQSRTRRVRLRSINEAPYVVLDGDGQADLNWMFAAYVNEDHPLVRQILTSALRSGIVSRFDGYQSGDPEQVYRQVFAIWHVLQRRGIRYSSITRTSTVNDKVLSQYVRFLDESWNNSQANCVDGSVLLASILRKIDLNPSLVLVPGHMFLAFDLDPQGNERAYLETTELGSVKRHGNGHLKGLADKLDGDVSESASMASFESAVARGVAQYEGARDKFDDERQPEYQVIDLEAARRMGVTPIAGTK